MKKGLLAIALVIGMTLASTPFAAAKSPKPAPVNSCNPLGAVITVANHSFFCVNKAGKQAWSEKSPAGTVCLKSGKTAIFKGRKYSCVLIKKHLIWDSGIILALGISNSKNQEPLLKSSINIVFDTNSALYQVPVQITRILDKSGYFITTDTQVVTRTTHLQNLDPGNYHFELLTPNIPTDSGTILGDLSATDLVMIGGDTATLLVQYQTYVPKSTAVPGQVKYSNFQRLSDGSLSFSSSDLEALHLTQGEPVILPQSDTLPNGYIGEVSKVEGSSFVLVPISIFTAIPKASINLTGNFSPQQVRIAPLFKPSPLLLRTTSSDGVLPTTQGKLLDDVPVEATVGCTLDGNASFTIGIKPVLKKEFHITWDSALNPVSAGEKSELTAAIEIGADLSIQGDTAAKLSCSATLTIKDIPIFEGITAEISGSLHGDVSLKGGIGKTISLPLYLNGGLQGTIKDGFHAYSIPNANSDAGSQLTTLEGEFGFTSELELWLRAGFGDIGNIFASVGPKLEGKWTLAKENCEILFDRDLSLAAEWKIGGELLSGKKEIAGTIAETHWPKVELGKYEISNAVCSKPLADTGTASVTTDSQNAVDTSVTTSSSGQAVLTPATSAGLPPFDVAVLKNPSRLPFDGSFKIPSLGQPITLAFETGGPLVCIDTYVPPVDASITDAVGTISVYNQQNGFTGAPRAIFDLGLGNHENTFSVSVEESGLYVYVFNFTHSVQDYIQIHIGHVYFGCKA